MSSSSLHRYTGSPIHDTGSEQRNFKASFCFEIFCLLCLPLRKRAERVNRKVKDQAERVISILS